MGDTDKIRYVKCYTDLYNMCSVMTIKIIVFIYICLCIDHFVHMREQRHIIHKRIFFSTEDFDIKTLVFSLMQQ